MSAPTEVVKGIWISSVEALKDRRFMQTIGAVVTAFPLNHRNVDEQQLDRLLAGKARYRVEVEDEPSALIQPYFEPVAKWIDQQRASNKAVLIHCYKGHGRSAVLAAYYLLTRYRWRFQTVNDVLAHIRSLRPSINPNQGFIRQLEESLPS